MKNMQKEIIFSNSTLKGQYLEQNEYGLYTGPKYKYQSKIFDYLLKKLLSAYMDAKRRKKYQKWGYCILVSKGTTHEKNKISFSIPEGLDYAEKPFHFMPNTNIRKFPLPVHVCQG